MTETAQLLAAITQQTELLSAILELLQRPKLGFVDSPATFPIYANRTNGGLWYTVQNQAVIVLEHAAITGYVRDLKFETVQRRGRDTIKLHLFLQGDRPYRLESGYDSHFSKGLLSAIAVTPQVQLQRHPITIQPQAGEDEAVLFCRVFIQGQPIKAAYGEDTNWREVAQMAKQAVSA